VDYAAAVGAEAFEKYRQDDRLEGLVGRMNVLLLPQWHTFAPIDVPADAKQFRITVELDRGVTAAVRLLDGAGKPVVGAESFRLGHPLADEVWAKPAATATFTATALRPGEKRRVMFVHTERKLAGSAVVAGGAKGPLDARMEPWGEVTGRLVGADGKPVAGAVYQTPEVVERRNLSLGASPFMDTESWGVASGPDGRFRVRGLVPGLTYRWTANAAGVSINPPTATLPDMVAAAGKTIDLGDIVLREQVP
jgi:hypothetical protein